MLPFGRLVRGNVFNEYRNVLTFLKIMILQIFQDALFAAIAAIGFSAISRPPRRAYLWCALIAAAGHASRFVLSGPDVGMHIIPASLLSSSIIGLLAVFISPHARIPAETCLFPALLPMIPGIYAYKAFGALALCMMSGQEEQFCHNFYLFANNALMASGIIMGMVTGGTLPIFILGKISFRATR